MLKKYKKNKVLYKYLEVSGFTFGVFLLLLFSTVQFTKAQEVVSGFDNIKLLGGAEIINQPVNDSKYITQNKIVSKSEKKISKSEKQEVKISRIKKLSKIERIVKSNHKQPTVFIATSPISEKFYEECIVNRSLSTSSIKTNSSQHFFVSSKITYISFNAYKELNFCSQNKNVLLSFLFKNKNFNNPPPFIS